MCLTRIVLYMYLYVRKKETTQNNISIQYRLLIVIIFLYHYTILEVLQRPSPLFRGFKLGYFFIKIRSSRLWSIFKQISSDDFKTRKMKTFWNNNSGKINIICHFRYDPQSYWISNARFQRFWDFFTSITLNKTNVSNNNALENRFKLSPISESHKMV